MAAEIRSVAGETNRRTFFNRHQTAGDPAKTQKTLTNSVLQELVQEIVDSGMAHDITEAYTLVIPAFARYNLLPTRADNVVSLYDDTESYGSAGSENGEKEEEEKEGGKIDGNCQNDKVDIK